MAWPTEPPLIECRHLCRDFPPVRALDRVSLTLRRGEVHGLIGENGAGKSTLMRILSGVERPGSGQILLDGEIVRFRNPADASAAGIAMVHQELNLVDELSVAANIFLGREPTRLGMIRPGELNARASRALKRIGAEIDPSIPVGELSVARQQMVEIAKAVATDAVVLILDEPTAVLTAHEARALFHLIDRLRRDGVAVVYISHILPEVVSLCDRVTVLRDGKVVTELDRHRAHELGETGLAGLMVGRPLSDHFPPRRAPGNDTRLRIDGLSVPGSGAGQSIQGVSFEVRRGEILGFAGLMGAGRSETAEAICGLRRKTAGRIEVDGKTVEVRHLRDAVAAGIAYLPEDRKGTGLTLRMSIEANTTLVRLGRYSRGLIDRRRERNAAAGHAERLRIKAPRLQDPVSTLSGGNQQKVLLAKWLETEPRILIVDEPTRGVDVGAKAEIYRLIAELADAGMACVMISSEMNELIGLCHRIAVMRLGRLVAIVPASTTSEEQLMYHAAGVADTGPAAATNADSDPTVAGSTNPGQTARDVTGPDHGRRRDTEETSL